MRAEREAGRTDLTAGSHGSQIFLHNRPVSGSDRIYDAHGAIAETGPV